MYIKTGKELLDLKIDKFKIPKYDWTIEIIRKPHPYIYFLNNKGEVINSYFLYNKTVIDLDMEPYIKENQYIFLIQSDKESDFERE